MLTHNNIHLSLPNGATFSIVQLTTQSTTTHEVAVLNHGKFVPVSDWSGYDHATDDVWRFNGGTADLAMLIAKATAWASRNL